MERRCSPHCNEHGDTIEDHPLLFVASYHKPYKYYVVVKILQHFSIKSRLIIHLQFLIPWTMILAFAKMYIVLDYVLKNSYLDCKIKLINLKHFKDFKFYFWLKLYRLSFCIPHLNSNISFHSATIFLPFFSSFLNSFYLSLPQGTTFL